MVFQLDLYSSTQLFDLVLADVEVPEEMIDDLSLLVCPVVLESLLLPLGSAIITMLQSQHRML